MKKNVKHRLKAAIALLSMAVVSTCAMAQSGELDAPADSRDNWSEFGLTGAEAGGADPRSNKPGKLNIGGLAVKPNLLQDRESGGVNFQSSRPSAAREWNRHIYVREGAEAYNCALSLAIGGELKSDGYVGSRLFGRTQTLNRSGKSVD